MNGRVDLINPFADKEVVIPSYSLIKPKSAATKFLMPLNPKDSPETIRAMLVEWLRTSSDSFTKNPNRFMPDSISDGTLTISKRISAGRTSYIVDHGGTTLSVEALPGDPTSGKLWEFFRQISNKNGPQGYKSLFDRALRQLSDARLYGSPEDLDKTAVDASKLVLDKHPASIAMQLTPANEITRISWKNGKLFAKEKLPKLENIFEKLRELIENSIIISDNLITQNKFSRLNLSKTNKSVTFPDGSRLFIGNKSGKPIVGVSYNFFEKRVLEYVTTGYGGVFDNLRKEAEVLFKRLKQIAPVLKVVTRR